MLRQILGFLASLELEEEYGFLRAAEELAVLVAAHAQNSPGSSGVFSLVKLCLMCLAVCLGSAVRVLGALSGLSFESFRYLLCLVIAPMLPSRYCAYPRSLMSRLT